MSIEQASGAAGAFGLKWIAAGAAMGFVALLTVTLGFTVVPLAPGRETVDAARRLAAGLISSFVLGPPLAIKFIEWQPGMLAHWLKLLGAGNELWAYVATAAPIVAVTALAGFWIVAGFMAWFAKRAGKDIGEMAADAAATAKGMIP